MGDLIERLEAATGGSGELDALIWNATGGWAVSVPPAYTRSLDSALTLAERVLPGRCWLIERHKDGTGSVTLDEWNAYAEGSSVTGETPALALCIAILRAIPEDKS